MIINKELNEELNKEKLKNQQIKLNNNFTKSFEKILS